MRGKKTTNHYISIQAIVRLEILLNLNMCQIMKNGGRSFHKTKTNGRQQREAQCKDWGKNPSQQRRTSWKLQAKKSTLENSVPVTKQDMPPQQNL